MKRIIRALMIVLMMVLGTISIKATIYTDIDELSEDECVANMEMQRKKRCHINHIHTETCGGKYVHDRTKVYPGMNRRLRHHILKGHHKWHRDVCRRCHLTKKEVRKMEVQIRKMESEMRSSNAQKRIAREERHNAKVARHNAKVERHNARKLEKQNAKVERHNAKVEKHNAKLERHNAHKLEKQNAKIERHNAKIERRNAKRESRVKSEE